ncbi:ATP-binding protein [Peristeroidobacter agariperforans]|uniref:ATP-binding protein n=1 Tax=Peristeroidobacter agariperforans TaxID=268404 RepID=UPI001E64D363|nr:ATP-binding protein [Peristeroidobacter agariperforans]
MNSIALTEPTAPSHIDTANRKNLALLIQLRWMAVLGQVVTMAIVHFGLQIPLPLAPMAMVLGALLALNALSHLWLRQHLHISSQALFSALLLDVAALTVQLYFSGGATNPFTALYLLQIALAAVLLPGRGAWLIVVVTCAAFVGLIGINVPLAVRPPTSLLRLHILGLFVCFVLGAVLLVVFISRMSRNLQERDTYLVELKRRAAEEDHIVRLGLLASGAAHELGTPLASVSVILGDWRRMPEISQHPEMLQELLEMQAAIRRCKSILSGILMSAGEARGEAPVVTSLHRFLDEIARDWSDGRPSGTLQYHAGSGALGEDVKIVADPALKQVVTNLLDNAFEVSPGWIRLNAERRGDMLRMEVLDLGPGFTPEMLENFGKPYNSTKGRRGGGLGLFLVVNVIRKLGGSVSAHNRQPGGATVTVELPLAALEYREKDRG